MAVDCCSKFAKYFLFTFNSLIWIVGGTLLGVGIWMCVSRDAAELLRIATTDTSDSLIRGAAVTLIIVGVFVFVVAFLGCCGACKESSGMLLTYAVIITILFVIQVIAGICGVVFKDKILDVLGSSMNETVISRYGQPGMDETTQSWDYMQRSFKCCGSEGIKDWESSEWHKDNVNQTVPVTCCLLKNPNVYDENPKPENMAKCQNAAKAPIPSESPDASFIHLNGCEQQLQNWVTKHATTLAAVAFGLCIIQIIAICFACIIRHGKKSEYEYV